MKNKHKISRFKSKNVATAFTGQNLTLYAGLAPIMRYVRKMKLGKHLNEMFPTVMHNSSKFSNVHVLMSVILASLAGVHRMIRIANFSQDALVRSLLDLPKGLNKDVIGMRLKRLGQSGAQRLLEYFLSWSSQWLDRSGLKSITIDADSTVSTVYGKQQGAARGYNSEKRGARSYHPLLAFMSEMKIVINSWFRTGNAYTSNGICDFVRQTVAILPERIQDVFFRADSGFFNGELMDLLEELGWQYLIKVKLKNLKQLLKDQQWVELADNSGVSICEFDYKGHGWKNSRRLKAIRTVKGWVEVECFGELECVPEYEYSCFCSTLNLDAAGLYGKYKERSTSETWIEQVKSQLLAGKTLTDNFHANDILWQLQVFAYNLSVMMRYKIRKFWQEEHQSFREWFIHLPAKLVNSGGRISMKIYENYYYLDKWSELEKCLNGT
jgi:hypothetical protein